MTRRVLFGFLTVTVLVLLLLEVPLGIFYSRREVERLTADVERDASVIATIYEDDLEAGRTPDPRPAQQYAARTGARVVVTDARGIARVDTEQAVPRDFSTRPEMVAAMGGRRASGKRHSDTLGTDLVYVALPVASGGQVHGTLRVSLTTRDVDVRVHRYWMGLLGVAAVVLAAMAFVGWAIARSVTRPVRQLTETAARFAEGDLTMGDDEERHAGPAELQMLAATMGTMAVRLSALLEEQRSFVADASHQLRTPLTALRLRLENLRADADRSEHGSLDAAIGETERLSALVGELLQLARVDRRPAAVPTDLATVTRDRVDTWSAVADADGVELVLEGADRIASALAVPGAVEQILDNTLDNALNASPTGGTITVRIEQGTVVHRLTISDQGPGLSDEDKGRATRRFWRGSPATAGTGLGLAIAEALATASGGTLTLSDAPGHGLSVTVSLPAAVDRAITRRSPDDH